MKNSNRVKKFMTLVVALVFSYNPPSFAAEIMAVVPQVELIIPGMTRTIEIIQNYEFPLDQSSLLFLVLGYGGVSITLRKVDTEGDLLVLAGVGISSAGIAPVFKFGTTEVTLTEAVEIGDEHAPYGMVWITSWVDSSTHTPPYYYTLTLSF